MERSCSDTNGKQYSPVETLNVMEGINTLWTGDADLRLYITTVQDG